MVKALRALTGQPRPSSVTIPGLLEGHEVIARRVDHWFRRQPSPDWPGPADHRAAVAASDACSVL
jgi:hypothetical protein